MKNPVTADLNEPRDSFLQYLAAEKNLSPHTVKAYKIDVNQFISYVKKAGLRLEDIDHKFIRRYLAFLSNYSLSRSTIARKVAAIRAFFAFLISHHRVIDKNPAAVVALAGHRRRLPKIASPAGIDILLSMPPADTPIGQRDRAIMEVLYGAGIRVAELTGADLQHVDFESGEILVFGKGSKERIAPLNDRAVAAVRKYIAHGRCRLLSTSTTDERALFLNRYGKRLGTGSVRRAVKRYVRECAEVKEVTPHTFRHSFATHMLEGGASLRVVQELLGHVDLSSTQIYTHLSKSELRDAYLRAHPRGEGVSCDTDDSGE